jgi:hypothetical protein
VGALVAGIGVAESEIDVLNTLSSTLKGRLYDTGEVYADGFDRPALATAVDRAGIAPDSAICSLERGSAGRGVMCLRLALSAVLAHTSELTLALFAGRRNGNASKGPLCIGVCLASGDYFRYSTARPGWRFDGLVVAGYDGGEVEQGVRSAVERSLVRAEVTAADMGSTLVAASDPVREALEGAMSDAAPVGHRTFERTADVLAAISKGAPDQDAPVKRPANVVLLEDHETTLCTFVVTPLDVEQG